MGWITLNHLSNEDQTSDFNKNLAQKYLQTQAGFTAH